MATTIFPQNDPNPADETQFSQQLAVPGVAYNHVLQGGAVSINSGLNVDVAPVRAFIQGTYIDVDSTVTLSMADNATNFIYLELTRSSNLIQSPASDEDNFLVSSLSSDSTVDRVLIARVDTSSGGVSNIYDMRWMSPGLSWSRALHNQLTINSDTSANRVAELQMPIFRHIDGEFNYAHFTACVVCEGTANTGITIGYELLELPGNPSFAWHAIDSGGTLVDSGYLALNAVTGTFLDTASAFDGMVIINGRIPTIDDNSPFWFTVAQNTSNADDTRVKLGTQLRFTQSRRFWDVTGDKLR